MSKIIPNLPLLALGTSISLFPRINTDASLQGINLADYLPPKIAEPCDNPNLEAYTLIPVETEMFVRANTVIGTEAQLVVEFNERADRWEKETAIYSAPGPALLHKDYIAIIAKGVANKKIIVPMILKRLQTSGSDWFFALENIAGENPAKNAETFADALNAWCGWAKTQGLIKDTNEVLAA